MPIRPNDIKVKTKNMEQFVLALHCEAKPIIQHYRMKLCGKHGQAQFFEGETARLAVTGVGSLSSAVATTAMGERFPSNDSTWLNIGICGGEDLAIGEAFIGNKITSDYSRDVFYPQLVGKSPWPGIEIKTLNAPSNRYETNRVFDMEAFGFYTAALTFASSERVQCIKIISDNSDSPTGAHFNKTEISSLIASQIPKIDSFLENTGFSKAEYYMKGWANDLLTKAKTRYSFTETERHQLSSRIRQLDALLDLEEGLCLQLLLNSPKKGKFLQQLQFKIDQVSPQRVC